MLGIENKFDSLLKENEVLKEMIKSKTDDFEQMKYMLLNLTNMFEKYTHDKNINNYNGKDNNFTTDTSKYLNSKDTF